MGFFSKAFKGKDANGTPTSKPKKKHIQGNGAVPAPPPKPHWEDAWTRKVVEPEEIQELLRGCTYEMKSRGTERALCAKISLLTAKHSPRHALLPPAF